MAFNVEDKIEWNQLSTSLQERFKDLEKRAQENLTQCINNAATIVQNKREIDANTDRIRDLYALADSSYSDCMTALSNIKVPPAGDSTDQYFFQGESGQIAKIDAASLKRLFPHNNFELRLVYSTDDERNTMLGNVSYTRSVMNSIGDDNIYDLKQNIVYKIDSGNGLSQVGGADTGILMSRCFFLNPVTKCFYFFRFRVNYDLINRGSDSDIGVVVSTFSDGRIAQ